MLLNHDRHQTGAAPFRLPDGDPPPCAGSSADRPPACSCACCSCRSSSAPSCRCSASPGALLFWRAVDSIQDLVHLATTQLHDLTAGTWPAPSSWCRSGSSPGCSPSRARNRRRRVRWRTDAPTIAAGASLTSLSAGPAVTASAAIPVNHARVLRLALPMTLANVTTPLLASSRAAVIAGWGRGPARRHLAGRRHLSMRSSGPSARCAWRRRASPRRRSARVTSRRWTAPRPRPAPGRSPPRHRAAAMAPRAAAFAVSGASPAVVAALSSYFHTASSRRPSCWRTTPCSARCSAGGGPISPRGCRSRSTSSTSRSPSPWCSWPISASRGGSWRRSGAEAAGLVLGLFVVSRARLAPVPGAAGGDPRRGRAEADAGRERRRHPADARDHRGHRHLLGARGARAT